MSQQICTLNICTLDAIAIIVGLGHIGLGRERGTGAGKRHLSRVRAGFCTLDTIAIIIGLGHI